MSSPPTRPVGAVPTFKFEYIIDPSAIPASRIDKEIKDLKHCKKIDEYEQHFCFFDNNNLTLYHQSVLRADGSMLTCAFMIFELKTICKEKPYRRCSIGNYGKVKF